MHYHAQAFILTTPCFFIPCGTMFPRNLSYAGHVVKSRASEAIAGRRSRGPESTRSSSEHVRQRRFK